VIKLETLKEQLVATEAEFEQIKSHMYRCDGVIQMLKHLIKQEEAETPEKPATEKVTRMYTKKSAEKSVSE
jgi:phage shock protein A